MVNERWDAVIVGAGPAGAVAAALLAERGWQVLLLERCHWPRDKVCGGCLNAAAIAMLRHAGLAKALRTSQPNRLHRLSLHVRHQKLSLALPEGLAIPRALLDAHLVDEAVKRGCIFRPDTTATLLPADSTDSFRKINVSLHGTTQTLQAKVVLACDGIAGTLLEREPWATWHVAKNTWFGVATTLDLPHQGANSHANAIRMNVGTGGYVGLARYGDGRTHLAAAIDPARCRAAGGPAPLIQKILHECRIPVPPQLPASNFHGTGLLTRRRAAIGGHRVLTVGDACGYVEPFTGEGIAWAIRAALEVVQLLPHSPHHWPTHLPDAWAQRHRATLDAQQRWCRLLRRTLRYPSLASCAIAVTTLLPGLAHTLAEHISRASLSPTHTPQGVGA